ncbi:succinate dehydrogenase flavoprotein subunit [Klebsiella pneumoniae subsp. ozaenae]|uniref:Succinate dehydrogenase flavoprotein subunit n=1 Tax=Klebsiella pneumoniae subsp. ozaenae TaxID=574 RepID=A0A377Z8D5_KLEPO|nr:succinate dehydrogenase flavoprotein subunit [Klebsiella pneumoniae subsp. ozaenae]
MRRRRRGDPGPVRGRRNRLRIGPRRQPSGGNSLLDLVVFGRAAGLHLQESIAEQGTLRDASESDIEGSLDSPQPLEQHPLW